ncbi:(R)-mandelonitrile lyase-like [Cannabis sativa]|uniref:(R)-mandelonitrile lyase-like n=1 Tax=Cannabis sativa TaxID=3483 RepID=UPI0029C9F375|nr:(R)-mandelonitrile lyase-like [Cannabis sativa]
MTQNMWNSLVISGNKIAVFFFLIRWSLCFPIPRQTMPACSTTPTQEKRLPHMTSNVNEISGKSFDYIIVGGGTTGCPLAATLSERFSVLLVERGGSPYGNPLIMDKRFYGLSLIQNDENSSVAQSFISEDGVPNLRGRVLGGSSALNGGFYSRASGDFVKQAGWNEEMVKDAYEWIESKVVFKPELTPWQTVAEFSFLETGILPYNGYSLEHIEGTKVGGSIFDQCGRRHTSADLLMAGNSKNITVLLNATVMDVFFGNNSKTEEKIALGIRFIKSDGSSHKIHRVYLNQPNDSSSLGDVILAAGALGSPQILMLSGIGSYKHLKSFNLPLVTDLKRVGHGMKDSPGLAVYVDSKPQKRLPDPPQVVGITDNFKTIIQSLVLPLSFNQTRIPIATKLSFTASEGKLELTNTDPRNNPSVKFNYLDKEEDSKGCIRMAKLLQKVESSQSIAWYLGTEKHNNHVLAMTSEDELKKFCKKNVRTFYHYHGGCLVGSVVDKDYRVYGVEGLRVVDGSTLSESPGTNPMATLLMLGRYQGKKIIQERTSSANSGQQNR